MPPVQIGSQSQDAGSWKRFVQSENIVVLGYVPPGLTTVASVGVVAETVTPKAEPEAKDTALFGTHIREAVRVFRR
jgi:hypothetical protein